MRNLFDTSDISHRSKSPRTRFSYNSIVREGQERDIMILITFGATRMLLGNERDWKRRCLLPVSADSLNNPQVNLIPAVMCYARFSWNAVRLRLLHWFKSGCKLPV